MGNIQQMIEDLCPNGVEYKELESLGAFYSGLSGKSKDDFKDGNAKFITYVNVYSNPSVDLNVDTLVKVDATEKQNAVKYGDVLFTGSSETPDECGMSAVVTEAVNENIYLNSFCFGFRLYDSDVFLPAFLKHLFRSQDLRKQISQTASGVTRFNVSKKRFAKIRIPVPPLAVQSEIVKYLDNFTELTAGLTAELTAELTARKKQYEYYRNKLLSFSDIANRGQIDDIGYLKLGDICDILTGFPFDSSKFVKNGIRLLRGMNIKRGYLDFDESNNKYWDSTSDLDKYQLKSGDIAIAMDGSLVGRSYGMVKQEELPMLLVQRVARLRTTKENIRYVYYYITNGFTEYVDKNKTAGAVPHISQKDIANFPITLPPIEEQERIVAILDRFEKLTNDIADGLPAEIKARQQQYEYYRNKLLTFKQKASA